MTNTVAGKEGSQHQVSSYAELYDCRGSMLRGLQALGVDIDSCCYLSTTLIQRAIDDPAFFQAMVEQELIILADNSLKH